MIRQICIDNRVVQFVSNLEVCVYHSPEVGYRVDVTNPASNRIVYKVEHVKSGRRAMSLVRRYMRQTGHTVGGSECSG